MPPRCPRWWGPRRAGPPWWPEGEPWPPRGRPATEAWRRMRKHFLRRAAVFLAALVALAAGASAVLQGGVRIVLRLAGVPARAAGAGEYLLAAAFVVRLLAVAAAVAAGGACRRIVRPIEDLLSALGRASDGDFSVRVPEHGPPDVRTLARSFNAMAERLERQEERRRTLFTDISHELRTPMAVLQGTLEGMLDGVYPWDSEHLAASLEEVRVLGRLIEDLRTIATAEARGLQLVKAPVDLAALARDAVAAFEGQARQAGVRLAVAADAGLPAVEVDADRIRQVLDNLLSNAMRYTRRGGTIRIACTADGVERVALSVEDNGAGIPPEDLPHIFTRFYKSRESRGSGLGLAIARALVRAHGGEISADSRPGPGHRHPHGASPPRSGVRPAPSCSHMVEEVERCAAQPVAGRDMPAVRGRRTAVVFLAAGYGHLATSRRRPEAGATSRRLFCPCRRRRSTA
jgi:two-component system sensor histidine kinase BaeS